MTARDVVQSRLPIFLLVIVLLAAFLLYVTLITPEKFGLYYDDGIYMAAAKSLATNRGYRFISLPHEPFQTEVPPFYPLLLSVVWRANPNFPNNVSLMLLLSVIATIAFLGLSWRFFVKGSYATEWQALLIVFLVAINVRTMMLATAVLAEPFYTALSISGLYLAERYEKEKRGWIAGVILGIVLGITFLTRSTGLALLIAVFVYYMVKKPSSRSLMPVAVGSFFVLGWFYWCLINRNTVEGVNAAYYTSYLTSLKEAISQLQDLNSSSKLTSLISVIGTNFFGLIVVSIPLECLDLHYFGGGMVSVLTVFLGFAVTTMGFLKHSSSGFRLLHIYVICYLILQMIRPYARYERFLMPLLPFLLLFMTIGLGTLISLIKKEMKLEGKAVKKLSINAVSLLLTLAVALTLVNYGAGLYSWLAGQSSSTTMTDNQQAINWVNTNTDASDVLLCSRESMYNLYTGRKATRYFPINLLETFPFQSHAPSSDQLIRLMLQIVSESKGQYLIVTSSDAEYECDPCEASIEELLQRYPNIFAAVFNSSDGRSSIYRIANNVELYTQ